MPRSRSASSAPDARLAGTAALVGPTASGKTGVAILVAEALGCGVIGCDSRQVYRGLDIGTAKPAPAQLARVRHHLVGVADPAERFSAGRYRDAVLALLPALRAAGELPFFVGGTGLYLRAALDGLCPAPPAAPELRAWLSALAAERPGGLHPLLERVDPAAAARIHPNDRYRITRALEVWFLSGEPLSVRQREHRLGARSAGTTLTVALSLPPPELDARIRARLGAMMDAGFLEEARALLEAGVDESLPAFRAVGYPQLFAHLRGGTSLDAALEATRRATAQYARRQLIWFRAVPGVAWIDAGGRGEESVAAEVLERLRAAGLAP